MIRNLIRKALCLIGLHRWHRRETWTPEWCGEDFRLVRDRSRYCARCYREVTTGDGG